MDPQVGKYLKRGAIAGVVGLALVLSGLVIWGVCTHREGGLLEVCWKDNQAVYVGGTEGEHGTCERPQELVWPKEQIPITLASFSAEGEPLPETAPETKLLTRVVDSLNWQVGFTLFVPGAGLHPAAGRVRFGEPFQLGPRTEHVPAGYVRHYRVGRDHDGDPHRALLRGDVHIRTDVAASDRLLQPVLEHELLHLAGLAHDDFVQSVMHPLTPDDWSLDWLQASCVTNHDVKLLQGLYRIRELH